MKQIHHWIDGKPVLGESGRRGPVYDPALGVQTAEVDLASAAEVDTAVQAASRPALEAGAGRRSAGAPASCSASASCSTPTADELAAAVTAEHGKVLSDAAGEVARGLENVEFSCGIPHLLKGSALRAGVGRASTSTPCCNPLGVVAGITPFNFPVMVPLWMCSNAIACGNTFVLKPSEKDPSASLLLAELWPRRACPTASSTSSRATRRRSTRLLDAPGYRRRLLRRLDADRPLRLRDRHRATASGCRPSAGPRTTWSCCPTPTSAAPPTPPSRPGTARPASAAWPSRWSSPSAASPTRWSTAIAARIPGVVVGPGDDPDAEMGPLVTAEHRDRVAGYVAGRRGRGAPPSSSTGDRRRRPGRGSSSAARWWTRSAGHGASTTTRSSARCSRSSGSRPTTRPSRWSTPTPTATASPSSPATAARPAGSRPTSRSAWSGSTCPIPVPVGSYSFGGWKDSIFGDSPMYGPDGIRFYTRTKVVTSRWPDPATSSIDLGFPQTR